MKGPWYITVRAVRDYLAIQHRPDVTEGPIFERATAELIGMATETAGSSREVKLMQSGALLYKGPRPLRLRFVVTPAPRQEGDAPQLVNVWPAGGAEAHRGGRE